MRLRKICSALMLLVITSQIFASTIFTASEIVNYTNENETAEVSSDTSSQTSEEKTDAGESEEKSEGTSTARGLVSPTTNYNIKAEDGIVADVGNLRDGTASWNEQEGPGWDTGDKNGIVRTFDSVSYRVDFSYNNADIVTKDVIIRAIAPEGDYTWQTDSLNALGYEVTDHGNGTIDVRLKNVPAGSGAQTELTLFVGEQRHGDTFKPKFEFYLNDTNEEPITVLDQVPNTTVSAKSSINVMLNMMGSTSDHTIKIGDQSYGKQYLAYELQLVKVPENGGTIKGMELPDSSVPLEFNIDIDLEKTAGNITTKEEFYVYDYGFNSGKGFLENTNIHHDYLNYPPNYTARQYPLISKKSLQGYFHRYVVDSGNLKITQKNTEDLSSVLLERQYDTVKVSFTDFTGILRNNEMKLRSDGSVPFASGGLVVISEIDIKPSEKYTLKYTAEADKEDNADFTDTNPNDNIVNGVRTIEPVGSGRTVNTRMLYTSGTADNMLNGLAKEVLGKISGQHSNMEISGTRIDFTSSLESVNINDPRAFEIKPEKFSSNNWYDEVRLNTRKVDGSYKDINATELKVRKYGVVDFSQFGDIMDSKYYVGNPGTAVTTGGSTEYIDPIEQYILSLSGDENTIEWFDTADEAKSWADNNEGWYFVGFKTLVDLEPLNLNSEEYATISFQQGAMVELLNTEYTRYLFENYETAIWSVSYWFNSKEGAETESDILNSSQLANSNATTYGPFGYRKTTYDDNGTLERTHFPTYSNIRANSILPLGAKPTIKKTVTKIDGETLGSSSIVVPGIDEGVKWNIEVGLQSPIEIVKDTPLTVTDTVPLGLDLDESSIYPKTDPDRGIEVKITTNSEGQKVITWVFTSELAREEFSKLSYVTLVDPWTENNITFTETATADFLLDSYQVASEAGVLTQLRAGLTVQKLVNKTVIMPDEKDIVYTLKYRNMAGPGVTEDYKLYDLFPAKTDGRETTYTGSMKLKNVEIDHDDPGIEVKYTFDEGRTNQNIANAEFKTEAEWTALGKNIEDATGIYVWLPNVAANVIQSVKLTFDTNGNGAQDLLVNNFRMSYEFNGTTFPLLSNTVMSSVPGISKSIAKTEEGPFGDSLVLNQGEGTVATDTNKPNQFVYKIDVMVPKVKSGVTLDPFTVTDQIMPELNILNVKLVDEAGEEITDLNGDLTIDNNLVTYEFNNNLVDINGTVVSMFIKVEVKDTVADFDMYPDGKLPNVANLNIIDEDIESNEVVVEKVDTFIKKTVTDEDGNGLVSVGEKLTYTLEVSNPTDNDVLDVIVRDSMLEKLPEYLTFNNDVEIVGSKSSGKLEEATLVLAKVVANDKVIITYTITVNDIPKDVISISNIATDNGTDPETVDPETCDEVDCDETTTPVETPDTHIKKSVVDANGNGLASEGETLTYKLEVSNPTGNHAYDVAVRDSMLEKLPEYVTFNDDVKIEGSEFTGSLVDGTLVLDKVVAKGTVIITYTITVNELPEDITKLSNLATDNGVDPETVDPDTCDETDCDSTETPIQGDTKISKSIQDANGNGIVEIGEVLTYTIEVENYTINNAVDVVVRDSMLENTPSWLTFGNDVTINPADISYTGTLTDANLTFYTIAPGEIVTISYTMVVGPTLPTDEFKLVNIATDNGKDPDVIDPEECVESDDCASTTDPINAGVKIDKSVSDANGNGKVDGGEVLTYTIDVFNPSNDASAFNVVIRDSMLENVPAWLTYNEDVTVDPEDIDYTGSITDKGFTFTEIASQQKVTITYTMTAAEKLPTDIPAAINLVTSNGIDPTDPEACIAEDNCAETVTPLQGSTTIAKKLVDESGDGSIQGGEKLNYTVAVTNVTDVDAINIVVRDSMLEKTPEWLTYNNDMKLTNGIKYSGDLTTTGIVIDTIKAGETVEITYSMTVANPIPKDITQVVNVATDNGQDPSEIDPDGGKSTGEDYAVAIGVIDTISRLQVTGGNIMVILFSLVVMLVLSVFIKRRVSN